MEFTDIYSAAVLAAPIAFLALALLVARSDKKETHTYLWIAVCVFLALMNLFIALTTRFIESDRIALIVAKLSISSGAMVGFSFLAFSLSFLGALKRLRILVLISAAVTLSLNVLFWATTLFFTHVRSYGYGLKMPVAGPGMPLYLLLCLFNAAVPLVLFVRAFRRSSGRARQRLGYILVAMAVLAIAAIGSLAPTMQDSSLIALIPMLLLVGAPSLITYAIIRHQLWEIRTVIHKTALWLIASSLIVVPMVLVLRFGADFLKANLPESAILGALLLFAAFAAHYRVVQPWLDQRFARRKHDPIQVANRFNQEIMSLRGVRELGERLMQTVERTMYTKAPRVLVVSAGGEDLRDLDGKVVQEGIFTKGLGRWLATHNQVVEAALFDEYELDADVRRPLRRLLEAVGAVVVVPIVHEEELIGMVILGEKENLKAYTVGDFRILSRIRPAATVALANARLYDQLQGLTVSLERRVQLRTQELQQANESLQELDRLKSKFFANITHELRTPLTLILAPLEDLQLRLAGRAEAQDLEMMHRNVLRLLRQINELLDLAKVDAGELRLNASDVGLNRLLETTVGNFQPLARRKGVSLGFVPLDGDDTVVGDGDKLELVFSNLLANAVKFTPAKGRVQVALAGAPDRLTVSVTDTGIGIPVDYLDRVFDRFAQVDSGPTRRFEGAGIGLSLVKELVELHGGEVGVESAEGEGSEFHVTLRRGASLLRAPADARQRQATLGRREEPVGDAASTPMAPVRLNGEAWGAVDSPGGRFTRQRTPTGAPPDSRCVLVVEDNPDMRDYLGRRLLRHYHVTLCADGREALGEIGRRPPDLVLADVMMPELSGYELCRILKNDPPTASIPVILVTAHKGVDRTLEGFQSGADDYLTKPFNFRELLARIQVQLKLVEMSREVARHQKAAMMNLVAAGLAHEVRNPVNAILNAIAPLSELAGRNDAPSSEARDELLQAMSDSAQRIAQLCEDLLGVSRAHPEEETDWDVEGAVESAMRLLRYKYGARLERSDDLTVSKSLDHSRPVVVRTAQLNQVLLNLLDNAIRAMDCKGTLWVSTECSGGMFRLRVRDSGPGIEPGNEEQIFDPLYSTDTAGQSSGLGLYICRRIVDEHAGTIKVENAPAGGAEFSVELPC